ncbi:MAG TPA: ankyrin repeat domain-containing protein, partial [Gammaproteobacteria bacterium]|nr:ankyrin repeat domain-containing protein [Gammaproteobacteria bacterium]
NRNVNRIAELILAHANVNEVAPENQTSALMYAVIQNRLDIVEVLHLAGAVVNVKDRLGYTPLMYAAMNGHLDIVRFLLDQGAFHETLNNNNQTAVRLARNNRHEEIATLLESLPAPLRGFHTLQAVRAAGRLAPGIARAFAEEPNPVIRQNNVDLTEAALLGDEEHFHGLLRTGAHINAFNEYGVPVLAQAAAGGNINIVRFLLDQPETNINAGCALENKTALMRAVCAGHQAIVHLLLDRGAMVNIFDSTGNTAFIASTRTLNPAIEALLRNAGANTEHLNDYGMNAVRRLARPDSYAPLHTLFSQRQLDNRPQNPHYRAPTTPVSQFLAASYLAEMVADAHLISQVLALEEQKIPAPARHLEEKTVPAAAPKKPPSTFQERLAEINHNDEETPKDYLCPISHEFINDPVAASSGIFYDRSSLIHYFESRNNQNPDELPCPIIPVFSISKKELESQPNVYFKNRLNDFVTEKEKAHAAKKKAEAALPPPPVVFPPSDLVNLRAARLRLFDRENAPRLYASAKNKSHGNTTRGFKKR